MKIIRLFREEMNGGSDSEPCADTSELEREVQRLRQSLRRRDRRIDYLKGKLRENAQKTQSELDNAREIIRGLEQALMMQTHAVDGTEEDRIAELEKELTAMVDYAESLHLRLGR